MVPMLIDPADQVVGDADVQHISVLIGHHINIICHNPPDAFYFRGDCHVAPLLAMTREKAISAMTVSRA